MVADFSRESASHRANAKRRKWVTLLFRYVHDLSLTQMVRFLTVPFAQLRKNAEENPPIDAYSRVSVNIPLRIFDKNLGEKLRTQRDIDRNQRLLDATQAQVFSDGYFTRARPQSSLDQGPNRAAQPEWDPAAEYVRGGNFPFQPTAPAAGGAQHRRNALAGQRLGFS